MELFWDLSAACAPWWKKHSRELTTWWSVGRSELFSALSIPSMWEQGTPVSDPPNGDWWQEKSRIQFWLFLPPPPSTLPTHSVSENQLALCFFFFFFFHSSPPFPPSFLLLLLFLFSGVTFKKEQTKKTQFYMRKYSVAPPWGGCWILKARGGTKVPN